jgi:hypothetical protein
LLHTTYWLHYAKNWNWTISEENKGEEERRITEMLLLHADGIYHQRVNFFLIAESIFILALAIVYSNENPQDFKKLIATGGLIFTLLLGLTLWRLNRSFNHLQNRFIELDETLAYKNYGDVGDDDLICINPLIIFTWIIPFCTTLFWFVVIRFVCT